METLVIDLDNGSPSEGKADAIRRAIECAILEDRLKPGDTLPTVRALADSLGINKNTVAVAYRQLRDGGLISGEGRQGSTVRRHASAAGARDATGRAAQTRFVRDGNPDVSLLPYEAEIHEAMARMSVEPRLYGEHRNDDAFVDWARTQFVDDRIEVSGGIFVSAGALDLIERALIVSGIRAGDRVAVEDPGYISVHSLVRSMGIDAVPLALDHAGIVPASLRKALKAGVKAVISTSRAHNPTGVVTSRARASELKKMVGGNSDVLFIDDDHTNLLNLAPYHSWHTGVRRWLTVRSLSKALGPDYRIAFSTGDAQTVQRLEDRQSVGMGWVSTLVQRLVLELVTTGSVQKKIAAAGVAYRERHQLLTAALKKRGFDVLPGAGLNVWVPLPNELEVAQRLFAAGWLVRAGHEFCLEGQQGIRVTAARMTPAETLDFVEALVKVCQTTSSTLSA
ncbi:aminotransferase class I/II-fold pyridoxal phosphate-dependent enzyme [Pandoraea pnomenusa]|uniref:aminotransferase class I/II-fold pyridoxal phosphate-dependent enzyme n=1 Tax=Pandoraea pnomenusa TaxID=93220 RepID=UPI001146D081|nr:aminotransferase class I/II-fold pyridoxal phosphate-dependent enzyme [Pandoraea pnomenusa]QDH60958.1 aminotransferase class I/II-fold pyridoxal phosphate-dependent enzyme [Pandoraea pnomenusa]